MPVNYPSAIIEKSRNIKLLICDVDGVLSDGKVSLSNTGDESKSFNIKDGLGIKLLLQNKITVAIITGRQSKLLELRAKELGIAHVYQNQQDKQAAFNDLLNQLQLPAEQVAYIGDDLPDLPLMKQVGLSVCVADGYHFVREKADWVTEKIGGQGAVREVADLLLTAQNKLDDILNDYL